jgi:hypothetical protein
VWSIQQTRYCSHHESVLTSTALFLIGRSWLVVPWDVRALARPPANSLLSMLCQADPSGAPGDFIGAVLAHLIPSVLSKPTESARGGRDIGLGTQQGLRFVF